jgi:predicted  nucleic acid-binding Zn-ribbon protein
MTFVVEDALADLAAEIQRLNAGQDAMRGALAKIGMQLESLAAVQTDIKGDLAAIRADRAQHDAAISSALGSISDYQQSTTATVQALQQHMTSIGLLLAAAAGAGAAKANGRVRGAANDHGRPGAA